MSPEQARCTVVDRRTDVWAFGCVLFELLTGRLAFPGETISDTIAAILARDPDYRLLPANTPEAVRRVLRRCLSRDPRVPSSHRRRARCLCRHARDRVPQQFLGFRFALERPEAPGLYRRSLVDGREQLLRKIPGMIDNGSAGFRPTQWTSDGRYILYDWKEDVHALPVDPAGEPINLTASPGFENSGRVSPDGRWLAFMASESFGDEHIYVQPFPGPAARTRVSTAVARHPRWRNDGRELVWMEVVPAGNTSSRTLVSVRLAFEGNIVRAEPPSVLPPNFTIASLVDSRAHVTMTPDAQRFLIRQSDGDPRPAQVILNWKDALTGNVD